MSVHVWRWARAAISAGVVASCLSVAQAGEALTLSRAIELARERAPQLQAQAAALAASTARADAAGRLPDPELMLGIENLPVNSSEAWSLSRDFMTMRTVGVMQSFPNARKRASQRQVAQASSDLVRSQTHEAELQIARSTAEAWADVFAAEHLESSLRALKPDLQLQARAVDAALRAGRTSSVDALTAQEAILELDDELLDAARGVRAARAMFTRWLGDDLGSQPLSETAAFDQLPTSADTLLRSLHHHASVRTLDAQIALSEREIELARAERRPDWSTQVAYSKRGDEFSDMVSVEFRVGLPLFAEHRQDALISAKHSDLQQLQAQREAELQMHREEVAGALATWQSARDRLDLLERERLPLARDRTKTALASYGSGGAGLRDVLMSVSAEIELQRNYAALTSELGRAWAFLQFLLPEEQP